MKCFPDTCSDVCFIYIYIYIYMVQRFILPANEAHLPPPPWCSVILIYIYIYLCVCIKTVPYVDCAHSSLTSFCHKMEGWSRSVAGELYQARRRFIVQGGHRCTTRLRYCTMLKLVFGLCCYISSTLNGANRCDCFFLNISFRMCV